MEAIVPQAPGVRLITQNLLASSRLVEEKGPREWAVIKDLAILIELFCLYDTCILISGTLQSNFETQDSELYGLLKDEQFVQIQPIRDDDLNGIIKIAEPHLSSLIQNPILEFRDLLESAVNSRVTQFGYWSGPDRQSDIDTAIGWLRSLNRPDVMDEVRVLIDKGGEHLYRATYFLARTFLYYGYSDQIEVPLTADITREPLLLKIVTNEELLREKILSALREAYADFPIYGERKLRKEIPPFAAYVFMQASLGEGDAATKRKKIFREMQILRHEIAPIRRDLRSIEQAGVRQASRDQLISTEERWFNAIAGIKKEFGHSPQTVTLKRGLSFASNILGALANPWNPAAWASVLSGAGFDVAQDILSRGPLIAVHKLRSHLPAPTELRQALDKLFPEGFY